MKNARRGAPLLRVLWWLAFAIFMLGLVWLGVYLFQTAIQERSISELSAFVRGSGDAPRVTATNEAPTPDAPPQATAEAHDDDEPSPTTAPLAQADVHEPDGLNADPQGDSAAQPEPEHAAKPDPTALRYRELAAKNGDFIGWIRIDGTRIDYPVMHSPAVPERYLSRDFDGNYSFSGLPFLDAICRVDDAPGNSIIYGHNMRAGGIFGDLKKYRRKSFLDENPVIRYDTLYGSGEYSIMAVFDLNATKRDAPQMLCYQLIDTDDADAIDKLNEYIRARALLFGGDAVARPGDRLLTLSTCVDNDSARRLVIMARRVAYTEYE